MNKKIEISTKHTNESRTVEAIKYFFLLFCYLLYEQNEVTIEISML